MSQPAASAHPGPVRAWLLAARPATLPAAITPVLVGTAAGVAEAPFRPGPFLAALLASILIQIGTNLANDYFDFKKGADTVERLGPVRVTQSGLIAPERVRLATILTFALAALVGLYLVAVGGWPILVIGLFSIAGVAGGAALAEALPEEVLRTLFAALLLVTAARLVWPELRRSVRAPRQPSA